MDIETAKSKSNRNRTIGWTLSLISFSIIIMSCVKLLYMTTREIDFSIINKICWYIYSLYERSDMFRFGWELSPDIHISNLISIDNAGSLALLSLFVLGLIIKDNGDKLAIRIAGVFEKAENQRWESYINGSSSAQTTNVDININLNEKWYIKIFQGILISVIAGCLVPILVKFFNT